MNIDRILSGAILSEANQTKQAIGAFLVSLIGRGYPTESDQFGDPLHPAIASRFPVEEPGNGRNLVDRLASVSAYGTGRAVMLPIAGHGDHDAAESYIVVGRVAQGRHDTPGTFSDVREHRDAGWKDPGGGVPLGRPRLNIPIPANVPTLISAYARVKVRSATAQTTCYGRIKIGSGDAVMPDDTGGTNAVSVPLEENVRYAFGQRGAAGFSDDWEDLEMHHARTVTIASDTQKPEGEIVPVRLYLYATSSAVTNRIRGGHMIVSRTCL